MRVVKARFPIMEDSNQQAQQAQHAQVSRVSKNNAWVHRCAIP